jgi:hypothetical protein
VIAYLGTSALLRLVLREPGALDDLRACEALLSLEEGASRRVVVSEWLEAVDLVLLQRPILARASDPFPTALGTLDGIHLATALVWSDRMRQTLVMATHDGGLALAARSFGMEVVGA